MQESVAGEHPANSYVTGCIALSMVVDRFALHRLSALTGQDMGTVPSASAPQMSSRKSHQVKRGHHQCRPAGTKAQRQECECSAGQARMRTQIEIVTDAGPI